MSKNRLANGKWIQKAALPTARTHCPTVSFAGKIYGFGGGGDDFKSLNSTIIYDPTRDSWQTGTNMPSLRSGTIACLIEDKIYVIGGGFKQANGTFKFLHKTEIYDPSKNQWDSGPDMIQPHDYPAGIVYHGAIYIMGGHHPNANLDGPKTDPGFDFCERLKPGAQTWEQIADLPTPRFALDSVILDDKIFTLGGVAFTPEGFNNFDHIESFDDKTGKWAVEKLKLPWTAAGAGAINHDGGFFIFGGYSGDGISDHAAVYDTQSSEWILLPPLPAPLAAMGVCAMDNRIFLAGGWTDDGRTPQSVFYEYQY